MDSAVCVLLQRGRVAGDPMVIEETSLTVSYLLCTYPSPLELGSGLRIAYQCGALEYVG